MCRTKRDTAVSHPKPRSRLSSSAPTSGAVTSGTTAAATSCSFPAAINSGSSNLTATSSTSSGVLSLSSLKDSLADNLILYSFAEIRSATNNFLSKRVSSSSPSSSSSWRCTLRGKEAVVFQREFHGDPARVPAILSYIGRTHHSSLVRLLGVSTGRDCIYLVYEHVNGANLSECLRNTKNPNYTPLSSWISRMQVATDLAQGLEYIHHHSGTASAIPSHRRTRLPVHNRITSSNMIITDPELRGKISQYGTTELTGEIEDEWENSNGSSGVGEIIPEQVRKPGGRRIEGTRGFMAPEIMRGGAPSQKSDVYAFGVVLLELFSGEQPLRYKYEGEKLESISLIVTAWDVIGGGEDEGEWEEEERRRRIRRWMDRRLKDSFPMEVAENVLRVALECAEEEVGKRPDMVKVASKLSRLLLDSRNWANKVKLPADFSVSMAPR